MNLKTKITFHSHPKQLDVLLFTRHLSTMIKAGISITEALSTVAEQSSSVAFKKVINGILLDVKNGQNLAKAFKKYPSVFDQFYISLIEVSEQSGTLDENLDFIAKQLAKKYSLQKKIQSAMLYPSLILTTATVMGGFISFFVLPQLVDFFDAFDIQLPLTTQILLFIANSFKNYGVFIIAGAALLFVLLRYLISLPGIKPHWHSFLLKVPVTGKFIIDSELAQFARNLGVLIKSGVSILTSIEVTANTLSNLKVKNDLQAVSVSLSKGKNIAVSMEQGGFTEFPPVVTKMIAIGEKTGKLDETLLYLAEFYEEEIDNTSKNLTTIMEPILLIVIGLVVGFIALSIITPIYELTGSIRN